MGTTSGTLVWQDLTVDDAEACRDFYQAVLGWSVRPEGMGDYEDYSMIPAGAEHPVAGICHRRGTNAALPPAWLLYFSVDDVDAAVAEAAAKGGKVLDGPRAMGPMSFACVQDPAGACFALLGPGKG